MPRKMSLACRERSESWWIKPVKVWQLTSSKEEKRTSRRVLRLPGSSSLAFQPYLADNRLTRRGSTVLWWKGIFKNSYYYQGGGQKVFTGSGTLRFKTKVAFLLCGSSARRCFLKQQTGAAEPRRRCLPSSIQIRADSAGWRDKNARKKCGKVQRKTRKYYNHLWKLEREPVTCSERTEGKQETEFK